MLKYKIMYVFMSAIIPISSMPILVSCSSHQIDQNFIDTTYNNIVKEGKGWTGQINVFASSVYNTETFRSTFRDQLPSEEELSKKGLKLQISTYDKSAYDKSGQAGFTVRLLNKKTNDYYPPTKTKLKGKYYEIINFTVSGFRLSTPEIDSDFEAAYNSIKNIELTTWGKGIFKNYNIKNYFSLKKSEPNWLGKAFTINNAPNFEWASFYNMFADDDKKIINITYYLKETSSGMVKGPGKKITLKEKI